VKKERYRKDGREREREREKVTTNNRRKREKAIRITGTERE